MSLISDNKICIKYHIEKDTVKFQRTPNWLTTDQLLSIHVFYHKAALMTEETGIIHEVDHIIPLEGKNVSGLHVPWNLQVITRSYI